MLRNNNNKYATFIYQISDVVEFAINVSVR